ncbi:hemerythrin domain-containing protein [Nocardiopsis sp. RSe5-2]|uniref:Hemerythrin domain-containing protein n=1 Tax=Nocardiopsis endophytica TaxID=3018445 RepID=A0ABT4U4D3_9ACTN|nr:hemerythrin domain-containing protein [Nocardiopsis endophytica]MDA2811566.1 hemerythrin domain-containing protein [Nocardiopsis endophytica]
MIPSGPGDGGAGQDVIDLLTAEHRELCTAFSHLCAAASEDGPRDPRVRPQAERAVAALVRHLSTEEQLLYPRLRGVHADGAVDRALVRHRELEGWMQDLERLTGSDPGFGHLLRLLADGVRWHAAEQESLLFRRFARDITEDERLRIGEQVPTARALAPTRPHPGVPDARPLKALVTPWIGVADRVRDFLSQRGG